MKDLLELFLELRVLSFHDILHAMSFFFREDIVRESTEGLGFQLIAEMAEVHTHLLE